MSPRKAGTAPIFALFLVLFVVSVGFGLVIPLLPLIARDFGASAFMLGMMTAGFAVVQFVFAPMWGQLSDRIGRKPVLMIGIVGLALSFLFMGFAQSFAGLFMGRVFGGFLGSAVLPSAQAMAAELSANSNRAGAMGVMGAAFGSGFIFGPLIGGVLAPFGIAVPFFAGSGLSLATVLLSAIVLREPQVDRARAEQAGADQRPSLLTNIARALSGPGTPYFVLAFVVMFSHSSIMTALAFFLTDRFGAGPSAVGVTFALLGGANALVQGVAIGPITGRLGERATITVGLGFGIAGFSLLVISPTIALALIPLVMTAVSMSLTRPAATSLLSKVTTQPQGITMGVQGSFDSLGRVVGPLWAGFAYDLVGFLPFLTAGLAFLLFWIYLKATTDATTSDADAKDAEKLPS